MKFRFEVGHGQELGHFTITKVSSPYLGVPDVDLYTRSVSIKRTDMAKVIVTSGDESRVYFNVITETLLIEEVRELADFLKTVDFVELLKQKLSEVS